MFASPVWWLALRRWGRQTEMAPSSTGQVEQNVIASRNKNAEIVIFDYWALPVHFNILLIKEGAAAHGSTTSAGVFPKP